MTDNRETSELIKLSKAQKTEGYWAELLSGNVLVWHHNTQIALLLASPDINRKVQDVVEKRREQLKEVERKTGWKPNS